MKVIILAVFLMGNLGTIEGIRPHRSVNQTIQNDIPPRLEWNGNFGYCGEVSFISAGLYYGQYISQYEARAIASKNGPQNKKSSQLLIGINDQYAASQMHLNVEEWNTIQEQTTDQFLSWVKQNVLAGYPVAIGVYTNEYLFYQDTDPTAGDGDYDHVVPVIGIQTSHPLNDPTYYGDDIILFSDNGLWGNDTNPQYYFSYSFDPFQLDRQQANAKNGPVYSLSNNGSNYGIAITGVLDFNGDTLPVRLDTNFNYEKPPIVDKSNTKPTPMPLTLTITVSGLQPQVDYILYKYNQMDQVPNSAFNANASQACEHWPIRIDTGNTYTLTEQISSDDIAVYRAVKATSP